MNNQTPAQLVDVESNDGSTYVMAATFTECRQIIGTCSHCYGPVSTNIYALQDQPRCDTCGYVAASPYGPTITTVPKNRTRVRIENAVPVVEHSTDGGITWYSDLQEPPPNE